MPAGAPSKYKPEYCDLVIAVGETGGTKVEMAEACDVHRETLDNWAKEHPEFFDAIKRGLQKAQSVWQKKGMQGVFGEVDGFNATGFIFNMKNRFKEDWRDKVEMEHSADSSLASMIAQRRAAVASIDGD